jgi:hypothetical protein
MAEDKIFTELMRLMGQKSAVELTKEVLGEMAMRFEISICRTCKTTGRMLNNFGECGDCTKKREAPEQEKLAALWEIAQEVAKDDPTYSTGFGDVVCIYCNGDQTWPSGNFRHEDTCIVTKARALMESKSE